jgi:hypothetical protein
MKKKNPNRIESNNGRMCRFYLKPKQEEYLQNIVSKTDQAPSAVLRTIIDDYEEISFIIKKIETEEYDKRKRFRTISK